MCKDIKYVKTDYVLWNDYHFKELSIMYIFRSTKYSVEDIKVDYNELINEGNYYQALKRLFSIYKQDQNKKEAVKLAKKAHCIHRVSVEMKKNRDQLQFFIFSDSFGIEIMQTTS